MPSKVLETVLTGRNLLSPVLTGAARDVDSYDAKVTAANARAAESASTSAARQEAAAAKVAASNARAAESSSVASKKMVESNARAAESSRAFAEVSESSAARAGVAWGSLATKGLPIAAAAAVVVTGKMAGDYQQLITKLETTAGESRKNLGMVSQGLLDMAGQVGVSADELAKGMYTVESAGYHGRDGLLVEKAAAEGAKQENADLGKVTDAVSTILHDYHLKASDAATVTSQLVTAVSHGKTNFDELTGSLHSVTPLAAKLHLTLADVTGTLSAMTASGESADQATQNMADTLRHLANPTNTMIAELSQLGISTDDLQKSLDSRGLAGTLQYVEDAIVHHLDPATQRVLLPALNQSKTAVQDLHIMLGQMPPDLAKMSQGLLDGSVSIKDYTKGAKDLGGPQAAMALQFLSLVKSSEGFNNVLKAGGPAAQVFTAAMAKSIGTSAGLNVMLQTTGENAAATNAAIKDIGSATAQNDGNIKGWAEVQGNLNQKLAETGAEAKSLAIEAGQHLLPVLTSVAGWVATDGLPGIEHLGAGVGNLVHDFTQLPAPVKDVTYALVAMRIADHIGLFDRLGSTVGGVRTMFAGFRDEIQVQRTLWAMNERSITEAGRGYSEVGGILSRTSGSLEAAGAGVGKFGATLSTLSMHTMAGLKTAGSSLMGMFGGPWGVAIVGATLVLPAFVGWIQKSGHVIDDTKVSTEGLTAAIQANNGAIDENVRREAASALQKAGLFKAAEQWGVSLKTLTDAALGNSAAMSEVSAAAARYKATQDAASHSSAAAADQTGLTADAYKKAALQSDTWLKAIQGVAGTTSGQVSDARQIQAAVNGVTAAVHNGASASDSFKAATAKAGVTVTDVWGSNTAEIKSATAQQIAALKSLGLSVRTLPNGHVVVTSNTKPAVDEINKMLAYYRHQSLTLQATLPSNGVLPGAGPARAHMASGGLFRGAGTGTSDSNLVAVSDHEFIVNAAATQANLSLLHAINSGAIRGFAAGGLVGGPTMQVGTVTPTVHMDTTGVGNQLAALIAHLKAALAGSVAAAPGAVGGNAALAKAMVSTIGWTGAQWDALYALGMRESGWRNTAQNPTSTAYGIAQFLDSTWATVGMSKTSDPGSQIIGMERYIQQRYDTPIGAMAHENRYGWYDNGGILPPGVSLAVNGTGSNEHTAVLTNPQWTALQALAAAAMPGYGQAAPSAFAGNLYLDSGEFLGKVRGEATTVVNGRLRDLQRKKAFR